MSRTVGISGVNDIGAIDDHVLFYNLFVCSSARFTSDDYLAGWYVQSGDTLVAVGSTKTGSMINDEDFYHHVRWRSHRRRLRLIGSPTPWTGATVA